MSEKKIVVPEAGLKAALAGFDSSSVYAFDRLEAGKSAVEAFCRWLSEHPIVPSEAEYRAWRSQWKMYEPSPVDTLLFFQHAQECMFLAPEPEVPEEIKDLLYAANGSIRVDNWPCQKIDDAIIEAYHRGQKSIPK